MTADFSQQRLRGRDFRGRDLRGARFVGADLRGARFRNADLTDADFSGARLGKSLRGTIATGLLTLLIGLLAGLLDGLAAFFLVAVISWFFETMQGISIEQHAMELAITTITSAGGIVAILLFFLWRRGVAGLFAGMGVIMAGAVAVAGAVATAVFFLPAFFVAWRIRKDDPLFAGVRQFGLWFGALGGTDFRGANLHGARFRGANLKHALFASASNLARVDFRDAKHLRFAHATGTLLEDPRVRELLAGGAGEAESYAGSNLQGACLAGASLRGADFTEADLSDAELVGADLRDARLIKTQLIGANLIGVRLTGACLAAWNIHKSTNLQEINCDHVFLEANNPRSRQPPSGAFREGEFSKLFQEVTETMDFIVESKLELAALQRAIQKLREAGAEGLEIQGVECREDVIVAHVAAPPEIDREEIHARTLREKGLETKLLLAESKAREAETKYLMQKEHTDDLMNLFDVSLRKETHIHAQGGNVNQNHRTQTITNSNLAGVTLNQGDIHGRLTNLARNIGALPAAPDAEEKLGQLLTRLAETLRDIPPEHAEKVEDVTDMAERTVKDARKGNPSRLRSTVEDLKSSARSLDSYPAVLQIVSEIAKLLGG